MPAAQGSSLAIGIVKGRNQANQHGQTGSEQNGAQTDLVSRRLSISSDCGDNSELGRC